MMTYEKVPSINEFIDLAINKISTLKAIKTIDISKNALDNVEKSKPVPTLSILRNRETIRTNTENTIDETDTYKTESFQNRYNYINTFNYYSTGILYNEHPLIKILVQKRMSSGIGTSSHIAAIVPDLLDERCYLLCKKGKDRDR